MYIILQFSECFLELFLITIYRRRIKKKKLILNVINFKGINAKISLVPYRFQSRYLLCSAELFA